MRALYLSHPEVEIDPAVPVPRWALSALGRRRAETFAARGVIPDGAAIFSSGEAKAVETARILAAPIGAPVARDPAMDENDRSATGFLAPDLFEAMAERFFAEPEASAEGWERAVDAQARIVAAVEAALAGLAPGRPAVFCGHGGVGTLLKCFVAGRPVSRREDQGARADAGGGNGFVFDLAAPRLHRDWTPFEALTPGWHRPEA